MAKPKFELTASLVNVHPEQEPEVTSAQPKNEQIQHVQPKIVDEPRADTNMRSFSSAALDTFSGRSHFVSQRPMQTLRNNSSVDQREEDKETSISMKISNDLKKAFHLWCVQRGITMTDAIEAAIKKYLQE